MFSGPSCQGKYRTKSNLTINIREYLYSQGHSQSSNVGGLQASGSLGPGGGGGGQVAPSGLPVGAELQTFGKVAFLLILMHEKPFH